MKKARIAASILCLFMLGTLVACDSSDTVIATVNGQALYKWQLQLMIEEQRPNFESQNGVDLSKAENWELLKIFKESLLNEIVNQAVAMEKARQLGLDTLSAEELADTDKQYDELVESNIQYYAQNYKDDPKAREKGLKDYERVLKKKNLTPERVKENINENKILMKLYKQEFASFEPTDEEIQAWFDENIAMQKERFDENPALFGEEGGAMQLYVPEGYVRVKHVFIGLPDDAKAQIQALSTQQGEIIMALANLGGDNVNADKDKLSAQLADIEKQIADAKQKGLDSVKKRAEEVYALAKSGTDFDFLIEKYNEDAGMNTSPGKELGYLVCPQTTTYVDEFKEASLALANVGDVSEVVASSLGYHIIRLYEKLTPGSPPLEKVRDSIAEIIQRNDSYTPMVDEREKWKQEMDIQLYLDRI